MRRKCLKSDKKMRGYILKTVVDGLLVSGVIFGVLWFVNFLADTIVGCD